MRLNKKESVFIQPFDNSEKFKTWPVKSTESERASTKSNNDLQEFQFNLRENFKGHVNQNDDSKSASYESVSANSMQLNEPLSNGSSSKLNKEFHELTVDEFINPVDRQIAVLTSSLSTDAKHAKHFNRFNRTTNSTLDYDQLDKTVEEFDEDFYENENESVQFEIEKDDNLDMSSFNNSNSKKFFNSTNLDSFSTDSSRNKLKKRT
jgi:hypothetical protein